MGCHAQIYRMILCVLNNCLSSVEHNYEEDIAMGWKNICLGLAYLHVLTLIKYHLTASIYKIINVSPTPSLQTSRQIPWTGNGQPLNLRVIAFYCTCEVQPLLININHYMPGISPWPLAFDLEPDLWPWHQSKANDNKQCRLNTNLGFWNGPVTHDPRSNASDCSTVDK